MEGADLEGKKNVEVGWPVSRGTNGRDAAIRLNKAISYRMDLSLTYFISAFVKRPQFRKLLPRLASQDFLDRGLTLGDLTPRLRATPATAHASVNHTGEHHAALTQSNFRDRTSK